MLEIPWVPMPILPPGIVAGPGDSWSCPICHSAVEPGGGIHGSCLRHLVYPNARPRKNLLGTRDTITEKR